MPPLFVLQHEEPVTHLLAALFVAIIEEKLHYQTFWQVVRFLDKSRFPRPFENVEVIPTEQISAAGAVIGKHIVNSASWQQIQGRSTQEQPCGGGQEKSSLPSNALIEIWLGEAGEQSAIVYMQEQSLTGGRPSRLCKLFPKCAVVPCC